MFQEAMQVLAWGSKETDTGQNTGDPRVMESSMLMSVIIWKMEVTWESKMYFILI